MAALGLATLPVPIDGAQASGGESSGNGPFFVPMDEVTVPIVESDRVNGSLRFKLVLDGGNAEAAARLSQALPQMRAAIVAAGLEFARLSVSGLRAVDAQRLDAQLTAAARAADPGVARVLIVEVEATRS